MNTGLNLIGKFSVIPEMTYIERNCRIMSRVEEYDFEKGIELMEKAELECC